MQTILATKCSIRRFFFSFERLLISVSAFPHSVTMKIQGKKLSNRRLYCQDCLQGFLRTYLKRFNFDVTGNCSMIKAMSEEGHDLMTYSSFYEFNLVSSDSKGKRSEFFTLSQPGGHPHNWNSLSSEPSLFF